MKGQTSTRTKVLHALMIVVLTILLLLFIAPFILVVINVFKTKADINTAPLALIGKHGFTLENFPRAMDKMNFRGHHHQRNHTDHPVLRDVRIRDRAQPLVEVRRHGVRTYGGLHGHSVPGAHGPARVRLRRPA